MMDIVLPHGVDSCSEVTGSDRLIEQMAVTSGSSDHKVPSQVHRHREHHHGHHLSSGSTDISHHSDHGDGQVPTTFVHERKMRREIANHNERKRMQSINAGFQSLRLLLPRNGNTSSVDRLSKAAILQQAVEYISFLMQERQQLLELNRQCVAASVCLSSALTSTSTETSKQCLPSPIPLIKRCRSSSDEELSEKAITAEVAPTSNGRVRVSEITVMRDRLKRRLPSEELSIDCSNSDLVAQSLDLNCCVKEVSVTSSDDPMHDQHIVSSTVLETMPALLTHDDKTGYSSSCISSSVSRRNLATIFQAIQYLEGKSFYNDDTSSIQSSTDSDRDSDRDSDTVPNTQVFEPYMMMNAASAMSNVKNSMTSLHADRYQPLASIN